MDSPTKCQLKVDYKLTQTKMINNLQPWLFKALDKFVQIKFNHCRKKLFRKNISGVVMKPKCFSKYYLLVDLTKDGIHKELFLAKTREEDNVEVFKQFISKNNINIILEIGANIGFFILLEREVLVNTPIIAFEPVTENFLLLTLNLKLNNINNVKTFKKAVSYYSGKAVLKVPKQGNWASMHENILFNDFYEESVDSISLKDIIENFCKNSPFLIRMDIEGYEYDLFLKSQDYLKSISNYWVVMELHPQILGIERSIKFIDFLIRSKFTLYKAVGDYPIIISLLPDKIKNFYKKIYPPIKSIQYISSWEDLKQYIYRYQRTIHLYIYKQ